MPEINIFFAIEKNDLEQVKSCLSSDPACLNKPNDDNKQTPLMMACDKGYERIVDFLLEQDDIEVNATKDSFSTPLIYAVENHHAEIVKKLLKQTHIDITQTNELNETPLIIAASKGDTAIFNLLLESVKAKKMQESLLVQSYRYGTALTAATFFNRTELADFQLPTIFVK